VGVSLPIDFPYSVSALKSVQQITTNRLAFAESLLGKLYLLGSWRCKFPSNCFNLLCMPRPTHQFQWRPLKLYSLNSNPRLLGGELVFGFGAKERAEGRGQGERTKDGKGSLCKVMKAVSIDRPPCRCFDYAPQVAIRLQTGLQRRRICSALITLNPWPKLGRPCFGNGFVFLPSRGINLRFDVQIAGLIGIDSESEWFESCLFIQYSVLLLTHSVVST